MNHVLDDVQDVHSTLLEGKIVLTFSFASNTILVLDIQELSW
jgi:hypothetical protein